MAWRNCQASLTLVAAINTKWPGRDKASDGTIGDAAHATRTSDHNPWVKEGAMGVVRARDIDVDGVALAWAFEELRKLGAAGDPRLRNGGYLILNRRITKPDWTGWAAYKGTNGHTLHGHVSFSRDKAGYDSQDGWAFLGAPATVISTPPTTPTFDPNGMATLTQGMRNDARVKALQAFLNRYNWQPALPLLPVTGNYLSQTVAVVRAAQAQSGVGGPDANGTVVGPQTKRAFAARGARW